jgi:hypothetical protein
MLNEDFFYFFSMKEEWFAGDYIKKLPSNFSDEKEKIDGN